MTNQCNNFYLLIIFKNTISSVSSFRLKIISAMIQLILNVSLEALLFIRCMNSIIIAFLNHVFVILDTNE